MYAGLGEKEQALAWGEKAYGERSDHLRSMQSEPIADPVRVDPGFKSLVRRIGLPEQDVRQFLAPRVSFTRFWKLSAQGLTGAGLLS
jgi:hypothetical protein